MRPVSYTLQGCFNQFSTNANYTTKPPLDKPQVQKGFPLPTPVQPHQSDHQPIAFQGQSPQLLIRSQNLLIDDLFGDGLTVPHQDITRNEQITLQPKQSQIKCRACPLLTSIKKFCSIHRKMPFIQLCRLLSPKQNLSTSHRRRVYDAVSVLTTLNILVQDRGILIIRTSYQKHAQRNNEIRQTISKLEKSIIAKKKVLQFQKKKWQTLNWLLKRNKEKKQQKKIQFPFILVQTNLKGKISKIQKNEVLIKGQRIKMIGDSDCSMHLFQDNLKTQF